MHKQQQAQAAAPVELRVVGVGELENGHGFYLVPSESDPTRFYAVEQWPTRLECQCKDAFYRRRACKHIRTVEVHKARLQLALAHAEDVRAELATSAPVVETSSASRGTDSTREAPQRQSQMNRTRAFSLLA